MTLRRWITFGSAAALIAAASACSDSGRTGTSPEGRAGSTTSRARTADAGSPEVRGTGNTSPTSPAPGSPNDTAGTSGNTTGSPSSTGNTSGSTTGGETKR